MFKLFLFAFMSMSFGLSQTAEARSPQAYQMDRSDDMDGVTVRGEITHSGVCKGSTTDYCFIIDDANLGKFVVFTTDQEVIDELNDAYANFKKVTVDCTEGTAEITSVTVH